MRSIFPKPKKSKLLTNSDYQNSCIKGSHKWHNVRTAVNGRISYRVCNVCEVIGLAPKKETPEFIPNFVDTIE